MNVLCLLLVSLFLVGCSSQDRPSRETSSSSGGDPRGDATQASAHPGEAAATDTLRLAVDMDDGSRSIGVPRQASLHVATPYATVEVPVTSIRSIDFKDQRGAVVVRMSNGDILQGALKLDVLQLHTRLGEVSIPVGMIRTITILSDQGRLDAGLLAYYPFDGNLQDASGNANNGRGHGAIPTEDRSGRPASAYLFNGVEDLVTIPHSASLRFQTQITICGWVNPRGFYQGHCLGNDIVRRGTRDEEKGIFFLRYGISCDDLFVPEEERFFFGINLRGLSSTWWVGGTSNVRAGAWTFVAGTYDGKSLKLFVNGVLEGSAPASGTIVNNEMDVTIGGNADPQFPYRVNGALDDIRIYDRALSESDILELFHRR
jgi:hypothetical protein